MLAMNLSTLVLFFPQSTHCNGYEHLLVTEMELSGKKVINTFSPHDSRLMFVEAIIWPLASSLIDHDISLRADLTAPRKSVDMPAPAE